jgi:hypothetical protein
VFFQKGGPVRKGYATGVLAARSGEKSSTTCLRYEVTIRNTSGLCCGLVGRLIRGEASPITPERLPRRSLALTHQEADGVV